MAFVLAQAICKKRSNGLRLLHLPLERSEDPPPISIFICSASRVSPISVKPESSALKLDGIWWKNPQSPNWLQREGVDRKNLYSPPESTINELSSQTVVIMRAALWRSCSRFGSVYLEFRPVFFLYESIFWELILWLCVGMQKGVLGNVSCRAYLQLVVPNARLIGKLLSGATPWRTVFIID